VTFEEWLEVGIEAGYCSYLVCQTHEGLPSTPEEDEEWDAGHDPCVSAVRIYPPSSHRMAPWLPRT
jgi:hypothetical protein